MNASAKTTKSRRGRKSMKEARTNEILDAATQIINQHGIGEVNLNQIARQLDLKYTTLYHYFRGRDALGKATLLRSYSRRLEQVAKAMDGADSGRERVLDFVRRELEQPDGARVKPGYLRTLSAEERDESESAWMALCRSLADLIEAGRSDGSIRTLNPLTTAIAIDTILNHFLRIPEMVKVIGASKTEIIDTVVGVLDRGILNPAQEMPTPDQVEEDIQDVLGWRVDPEDPDRERLERLLRTATVAFNNKGAEASIPDMAQDIGMSKTAFYHLFIDKEDLLMHTYIRAVDLVEACYTASETRYEDPLRQNLHKTIYLYLAHGSPIGPMSCFNALGALKPAHERLVAIRNRSARIRGQKRLQNGIDQKLLREVSPHIVQPMVAAMSYGLPYWYGIIQPLPLDQTAIENAGIIYQGLSA